MAFETDTPKVEIVCAATSPRTGALSADARSTLGELLVRLRELQASGEGYLEVHRPSADFPAILMGFRGDHAVIHLAYAQDSMALVRGDNSVPGSEQVEVLIIDEPALFSGEVVMTLDHAWQLVQEFARTGSIKEYEDWFQS
jgi:hypothetical protein